MQARLKVAFWALFLTLIHQFALADDVRIAILPPDGNDKWAGNTAFLRQKIDDELTKLNGVLVISSSKVDAAGAKLDDFAAIGKAVGGNLIVDAAIQKIYSTSANYFVATKLTVTSKIKINFIDVNVGADNPVYSHVYEGTKTLAAVVGQDANGNKTVTPLNTSDNQTEDSISDAIENMARDEKVLALLKHASN